MQRHIPATHLCCSNGKLGYVVTKYDNTFGRCFSLRVAKFITDAGLLNVELVGRMNIYVYLHHPGQFYDSDSKTKIYVNQGKMLFIDLTYELSRVTDALIKCTQCGLYETGYIVMVVGLVVCLNLSVNLT